MSDEITETPWEGKCIAAAAEFGFQCRELTDSNPYGDDVPPSLEILVSHLVTDLWDRFFSQAEIRSAFEMAVSKLPQYAAGEERRGDRGPSLN